MRVRIGIAIFLVLSLLLGGWIGQAFASPDAPDAAPGLVNYQGYLADTAGNAFTGTASLTFSVFDQLSGGAPLWSETQGGVPVNKGYFSVLLGSVTPITASHFSGAVRYLEVSVDTGSGAVVLPRQQFAAVPYAFQADSVPWNGVTGLPAGFADGVDAGDYAQVVTVAKAGAQFASIQAALDSITDASVNKRYLVWIAPGEYNEQVTMKAFVDLQGSGEGTTIIKSSGFNMSTTGTLVGANNAEARFLRVENSGGGMQFAIAIYTPNTDTRFTHVTAVATGAGGHNYGANTQGNTPVFSQSSISVSCSLGSNCMGIYNGGSNTALRNTSIRVVHSGGGYLYGINNSGGAGVWDNVTIETIGPLVNPNGNNFGILSQGGNFSLFNSRIKVSGANDAYGIVANAGQPVVRSSLIQVSNGGGLDVGVSYGAAAGQKLKILDSEIEAADHTIYTEGAGSVQTSSSMLSGGTATGVGIEVCAGVTDETFAFFTVGCP